jgi:dual-specificity kinase
MIHTDMKLENILLPPQFNVQSDFGKIPIKVKLIDFGSIASLRRWHQHLATTRIYRAPEIILGLKWSFECDIWSIGCLLLERLPGNIPFMAKDQICHCFLIQHMIDPPNMKGEAHKEAMNQPPLIHLIMHEPLLCDLALKMLEPDPFKRISLDAILDHPFVNQDDRTVRDRVFPVRQHKTIVQ